MRSSSSSRVVQRRAPLQTFFFAVCFMLVAVILSSCGALAVPFVEPTPTPSPRVQVPVLAPEHLISPGVLVIGSYTKYPPQEFTDDDGNVVGFDIDLVNTMAQRLGLKTRIVYADFPMLIDQLNEKDFDVVVSAVTITDALKKKVDFVPYFKGGEALLVEKGNPARISGLEDLCGKKVGVKSDTLEEKDLNMATKACLDQNKPPITLVIVHKPLEIIQLLITGEVDATFQDTALTDYFIKLNPGRFAMAGHVLNVNPQGIAVRKGEAALLKALQDTFASLQADGTYHYLITKWGLTSGEIKATDIKGRFRGLKTSCA